MAVSTPAVALMGGGAIFLWSAFHGASLTGSLRDLLQGKQPPGSDVNPAGLPGIQAVSDSGGTGTTAISTSQTAGSATDGHAALAQAARLYSWDTGSEWQALTYVEMREAGFNPQAKNPSSGALGLAQALGHGGQGTAGTLGNEYGGFGLTAAQARAANSGNAYWQAVWMVNYIHSTYGDPIHAAAHEQSHNWY